MQHDGHWFLSLGPHNAYHKSIFMNHDVLPPCACTGYASCLHLNSLSHNSTLTSPSHTHLTHLTSSLKLTLMSKCVCRVHPISHSGCGLDTSSSGGEPVDCTAVCSRFDGGCLCSLNAAGFPVILLHRDVPCNQLHSCLP